jgi:hypothetical protein
MADLNEQTRTSARALADKLRELASRLAELELPAAAVPAPGDDDFDAIRANAAQADLLLAHASALRRMLEGAPDASAWDEADAVAARALLLDLAQTAANFRWLSQAARARVTEAQAAVEAARGALESG